MSRLVIQFGRSKIILGLIVGIGFIFGYLNYSQSDDPLMGILPEEPLARRDDIESFRNFKIDSSILEDERYKSLEIYGENPVDLGVIGERRNPFAPF